MTGGNLGKVATAYISAAVWALTRGAHLELASIQATGFSFLEFQVLSHSIAITIIITSSSGGPIVSPAARRLPACSSSDCCPVMPQSWAPQFLLTRLFLFPSLGSHSVPVGFNRLSLLALHAQRPLVPPNLSRDVLQHSLFPPVPKRCSYHVWWQVQQSQFGKYVGVASDNDQWATVQGLCLVKPCLFSVPGGAVEAGISSHPRSPAGGNTCLLTENGLLSFFSQSEDETSSQLLATGWAHQRFHIKSSLFI